MSRLVLCVCLCVVVDAAIGAERRPNVVVIMADDLGYGDLSCYGATTFETPEIDKLASGGTRFVSGYCSAATCTPTRFSFLTGLHAFRRPRTGILPPNGVSPITPEDETLPKVLKRAGYKTAVVGKWHLGLGQPGEGPDWNAGITRGPIDFGFDHAFIMPTTNDRVPSVYVEGRSVVDLDPADPLYTQGPNVDMSQPSGKTHRETLRMDWSHGHNQTINNGISRIGWASGGEAAMWRDEDVADRFAAEACGFILRNATEPFFLFFASQDIHVPRMPHERFQGTTPHGFRGDAIMQLDYTVGVIRECLKEAGVADETMIVFCSDNGPVLDDGYKDGAVEKLGDHKPAGPYRGGKYSPYEGGTRTPFITYWPGTIPAGEVSDLVVSTIDLPRSLPALAGVTVADSSFPDSENRLAALLNEPGAEGREFVVEEGIRGCLGLRIGDWKYVQYQDKRALSPTAKTFSKKAGHRFELYTLADDPG
ncbi:MAG: sulfatase-like hydrolase/transferase, partial [Planctomycetota bacterium]